MKMRWRGILIARRRVLSTAVGRRRWSARIRSQGRGGLRFVRAAALV